MVSFLKNLFFGNTGKNEAKSKVVMKLDEAQVGENQIIFAIGDIHGCLNLLEEKIKTIELKMDELEDKYSFHMMFLGDYIDRGHQSFQVIEKLMKLEIDNCSVHCLMGNHEDILLKFLSNPLKYYQIWMAIGGAATLSSFGINGLDDPQQIKQEVLKKMGMKMLNFLSELEISHTIGDYFFCHAIPRSGLPLDQQSKHILINNRKAESNLYEKIVVHGHVSTDKVEFASARINIDTGAYATQNLTCLLIDNHHQMVL